MCYLYSGFLLSIKKRVEKMLRAGDTKGRYIKLPSCYAHNGKRVLKL